MHILLANIHLRMQLHAQLGAVANKTEEVCIGLEPITYKYSLIGHWQLPDIA